MTEKKIIDLCSTFMAEAMDSLMKTGEVISTAYCGKEERMQIMKFSLSNNKPEKFMIADYIRKEAAEMDAEFVIYISDSWIIQQNEIEASLDPNKKEAITLNCQYEDRSFVTIQEYTRTDDNQIILGDIYTEDYHAGKFASLLPKIEEHIESNV